MAKVYATLTAHFCTGDAQSTCLMAGANIVQHNKEVSKWWYTHHVWNSSYLETFEPDFWDLLFLARRGCSLDTYKTCQKKQCLPTFLGCWTADLSRHSLVLENLTHFSPRYKHRHWLTQTLLASDTHFKQNKIKKLLWPPHMTTENSFFPIFFPAFHEDAHNFVLI